MAATLTSTLSKLAPTGERVYSPHGVVGRVLMRAQRLQDTIQQLEKELKKDRAFLLQHMQRNNLHRIYCGDFSAQLKSRHNWQYSPETEREMLQVRVLQKRDINDGLAIDSPTPYVSLSTTPSL